MLRKLLIALSAIALVVGLAPAAVAQTTGSVRIDDFTFKATINTGQSQLRPGGYVRIDLTGTNTHGTRECPWGVCVPGTDSRVLNTYGFTVPAGYTLRGSGGNDMVNVGTHSQANYFGGQPGDVTSTNRIVGKNSSRSGWLSFNIPADAQGGSRHNFGIRAHLNTGGSWYPTQNNVVGFTLGTVATRTTLTADPATVQEGTQTTLTAAVSPAYGSNVVNSGNIEFLVNGSSVGSAPVGSDGRASVPYTAPLLDDRDPVTQNITARYSGASPRFAASQGSTNLTVDPEPKSEITSTVGLTATRGLVEDGRLPVTLDVEIATSNGLDLPQGAEVEIVRDGVVVDTVAVNGVTASLTDYLDADVPETVTHTYTARLLETETYDTIYRSAKSDPVEVTVSAEVTPELTVSVEPASVRVGRGVDITATMTAGGEPLPAGTDVIVRVNGRDVATLRTADDGTATLADHVFTSAGDKMVVAVFEGEQIDGVNYRAVTSAPTTVAVESLPEVDSDTVIELQTDVVAGDEVTITAHVTRADGSSLSEDQAAELGSVWFFRDGAAIGSAPVVLDPETRQATAVFTHRFAERGKFRITAEYSGLATDEATIAPSETSEATVVTVTTDDVIIDEPGPPPPNEIDLTFGSLDLGSVVDAVGPEGLSSLAGLLGGK